MFYSFGMKKIYFIVSFLFCFTLFAQFPIPIFHAPLNGNAVDISSNPLTVTGISGSYATGRCGDSNSAFFVGTGNNDAVKYNQSAKLNLTTEVTMAAWIFLNSLNNAASSPNFESEIISKDAYSLGIYSNGSLTSVGLDFEANNIPRSPLGIGSILPMAWTHVALTYKASDSFIRYYINGIFVDSYPSSSAMGVNSSPLFIGGYSNIGTYQFPGLIQDARIYNSKLTDTQIAQIYNSFSVNGPRLTTACGSSSALMSIQTLAGSNHNFQWYQNGVVMAGETASGLNLNPASNFAGGVFSVVGSNSCGTYTTLGATLLVPTVSGLEAISSFNSVCTSVITTLTCSAVGTNLSYRWYKNSVPISASTDGGVYKSFNSPLLSITGFPTSLAGSNIDFTCNVFNNCITLTSNIITISVLGLPTITGFSGNFIGCTGTDATITGFATNALSYQWFRSSILLNENTDGGIYGQSFSTAGLNISALPFANTSTVVSFNFSVVGVCGSFSRIANVTVLGTTSISGFIPPTNYCVGNTKSISINTLGGHNLAYTWGMYDNSETIFTPLSNASYLLNVGTVRGINTRNITISGLEANITDVFVCTVSGSCGIQISTAVGFTFLSNITATSLLGIIACQNDNVTFATTVSGAGPYAYKWFENTGGGFVSMGVNTSFANILSVNPSNNGNYYVSVAGFCNTVTTPSASLMVNSNSSATIPANTTICAGSMGNIVLTVTSVNPVYQWYKNNQIIDELTDNGMYGNSFTTSGLQLSNVPSSINGASFKCTIQGNCGGMITTTSTLVTVANLPLITLQPAPLFSTCAGLSASIEAQASGTGLNYRWQYFNTTLGVWANVTTTLGSFTGVNSSKLNAFKFNSTMNGLNFRVSVSGFCASNVASNVSTLQINFGPSVNIFGWKSSYCENEGATNLQAFTDLSFPLSTVSGTFSLISGSASINPTGFNTANFLPNTAPNNHLVYVKYQSAPNALGCSFATTLTAPINTISGFQLDWSSPSVGDNSYAVDDAQAVPLSISMATGVVGSTLFTATFQGMSQSGVTGNQFYPINISPKPTNAVNNNEISITLIATFTSSTTGCKSIITKDIKVFFPQNFYVFNPPSPLVDKSSFCATDFTPRLVSMTGALLDSPIRCTKSVGLGISGSNSSSFNGQSYFDSSTSKTRFFMDSYTFIGGNLTPQNYNLVYFYDFNPTSNLCNNLRVTQIIRPQEIKIFPIANRPKIRDYAKCESNANLSDLITATAENQNMEWYTTTSTSSIIPSLTGLTSVSLAQLGITSTGFATYKRYARQYQNGCPGHLQEIDVIIYKTPLPPTITSDLPSTGGCARGISTNFVVSISSNTIGSLAYLNGYQQPIISINSFATIVGGYLFNMDYTSSGPTIVTISGISFLGGCSSDITTFSFNINELPPTATLSGANNRCMDYDGIFRASPVKVSVNTNMPISFVGNYLLYYPNNSGSLSFSTNTVLGNNTSAAIVSDLNKTLTGFTQIYVYSVNTITGCKSNQYANFENQSINYYNVFSRPQSPFISTLDVFCNSPNYGIISVIGSNFAQVNWYNSLSGTTLLGLGNSLDLANCVGCMPFDRYKKANPIDTTYYVSQTSNGCESSLVGVSFRMFAPFQPMPIFTTSAGLAFGIELTKSDQLCSNKDFGSFRVRNRNAAPAPPFGAFRSFNLFAGTNYYYQFYGAEEFTFSLLGSLPVGSQIPYLVQEVYFTTLGKGCASPSTLTSGIAVVNQTPSAPILRDTAYCVPGVVGNLRAISTIAGSVAPTFTWYSSSNSILAQSSTVGSNVTVAGSTISGKFESFFSSSLSGVLQNSSASGVYLFYVSQKINGCESNPNDAKGNLFLYETPEPPTFTSTKKEICSGENIPLLGVGGQLSNYSRIDWFSAKNLGSIVGSNNTQYQPTISNNALWSGTSTSSVVSYFYATDLKYNTTTSSLIFGGCRSPFAVDSITVNALSPPPITSSLVKLCVENPKISTLPSLTASGINGAAQSFFWIDNNNQDSFQPKISINNLNLAVPRSYFYKVSDSFKNCKGLSSVITVTVFALPTITLNGINFNYCEYDTPVTFSGFTNASLMSSKYTIEATLFPFTVPSGMLSTLAGINTKAIFNPSAKDVLSTQSYDLSYIVTDNNNCSNEVTKPVNVYAKTINNFTFKDNFTQTQDTVCSGDDKIIMIGENAGSFATTRIGVVGNEFFPADVITNSNQIDTVSIKYTYTDINGCFNFTKKTITVYPSPKVKFKMSSHCVGNVSIAGLSTIVPKSGISINSYEWIIDNQKPTKSKDTIVNFNPGLHNFYYEAKESGFGCTSSIEVDSIIDAYPLVDFDWKNICEGDSTQFFDKSSIAIGSGTLDTLIWQFSNTYPSRGYNSFGKTFKIFSNNATSIPVSLMARTKENCVSTITSIVHILPTIKKYPYDQNFDNNQALWFTDGKSSTWEWGQNTITGENYWATNIYGNHAPNERSFLNSPCFNLDSLPRPMIRFDANYKTNSAIDGAVLQFSTNGGTVWQPLNDIRTGINWYNSRNIVNDPGDQNSFLTDILNNPVSAPVTGIYARQMGWNGNSFGWKTSRNTLDEPSRQTLGKNQKVRFRVAFASAGAVQADGFAIDNFWIGSRTKSVLLENFVNTQSIASNNAQSNTLDNFILNNRDDVVGINYHTSSPANDIFNAANPSDPSTRVLFYGVETVPRSALDGEMVVGNSTSIGLNSIKDKSLISPTFIIRANKSNFNNNLVINAMFEATENIPSSTELIAQVVVIEKSIKNVGGLPKNYYNVIRKMLPSGAGTSFFGAWNKGETKTLNLNWNYGNNTDIYYKDSLGVVLFIQDRNTKAVLQSAYYGPSQSNLALPLGVYNPENDFIENITIYPNPAANEVNIIYPKLTQNTLWQLYDSIGKEIKNGYLDPNLQIHTLNISSVVDGIYILKIGKTIKKLVISK